MKILNLYACLGGNRYKWDDCHEITAVELDPDLAEMYKKRFPKDEVIVGDAHQYLLDNFSRFDFIWSSPPCPSHSRSRFWGAKPNNKVKPIYPEMSLYQEILFLEHYFNGKYVVENVIPYYEPLIAAKKRGRHLYWTNFALPNVLSNRTFRCRQKDEVNDLCKFHKVDFSKYKGSQKKNKIARNLVDYEAGKTILDTALGVIAESKNGQIKMNF